MNNEARRRPEWPESAWRVHMAVEAPALGPCALQYAVFSEDPLAHFRADLLRADNAFRAQLNEAVDSSERQAKRVIQLKAVWHRLFRLVAGDEVYLLGSGCGDVAMMSTEPPGHKWLVTKPVQIAGRACAWALPFQAVAGQEVQISLRADNTLDLMALGATAADE